MATKTPAVGSQWVWEINKPHAIAVIEVTQVITNEDGETWVQSRILLGKQAMCSSTVVQDGYCWNSLERFLEACSEVAKRDGD